MVNRFAEIRSAGAVGVDKIGDRNRRFGVALDIIIGNVRLRICSVSANFGRAMNVYFMRSDERFRIRIAVNKINLDIHFADFFDDGFFV